MHHDRSLFIFLVISVLTIIAFAYPTKGIKIGTFELHFPSPEDILSRNNPNVLDPEEIIENQRIKKIDSLKHELKDTLN